MDDNRVWAFEEGLWTGTPQHYRELVDDECVMVLPMAPFVLTGAQAIKAAADTPRWSSVTLSEKHVMRPQDGLIVIAYKARAEREGLSAYFAFCTTTVRRFEHEVWRVVQHSQTQPSVVGVSQK